MVQQELIQFLKQKKHIIWDWNGTLLDDVDICVEIISNILTKYQLQPVSKQAYRQIFGFPVVKYYEKLGFDLQKTSFAELTREFISAYAERAYHCQLFQGCLDLLKELQQFNVRHSILSAANESHLHEILDHFDIKSLFDRIYGLSDDYAHGKITRGKELLAQLHCSPEHMVLVGDTDHDLEVGQALGVDVVLIGDGHQCPTRLRGLHHQVFATRYGSL